MTLLLERERTGSNGEWAHSREVTARLPESSYVACLLIVAQLLLSGEPANALFASICQETGLSSLRSCT